MTGLSPGQFVALFGGGPVGDPSLTFNQNFLLDSGSTMAMAALKVPVLTYAGNAGTSYIWNESGILVSTTNNQPRYYHDPVTGAALGILIEGQRDNDIVESADFSTPWTKQNADVSVNTTSGIFGTTTADTLTDQSGNTFHEVFHPEITVTTNTDQAFSVIAKKGTHDFLFMALQRSAQNSCGAVFDLVNGVVGDNDVGDTSGTITLHKMIDVGDGFYLCILVGKSTGASVFPLLGTAGSATPGIWDTISRPVFAGSVEGIILEAAQFEVDISYPSISHIPTAGATARRTAETCSATITTLLGSANTLLISARTGYNAGVVCQIDDGTENQRYRIERNASNEIHVIITDGGTVTDINLGVVADLTDFKVAVRLDDGADYFAASLDGAAVNVPPGGGTLPTVTTIRFGTDTSGDEWNSTIASVKLWNVGKPNAFLQSEAT